MRWHGRSGVTEVFVAFPDDGAGPGRSAVSLLFSGRPFPAAAARAGSPTSRIAARALRTAPAAPAPGPPARSPSCGGRCRGGRAARPPPPVTAAQLLPPGRAPAPRPPDWLPMTSPPRSPAGRPRLLPRPAALRRAAIGQRGRPSPPAPPPPSRTFTR